VGFVMVSVAQEQVFLGVHRLSRGLLEDVRRVVALHKWLLINETASILLCFRQINHVL